MWYLQSELSRCRFVPVFSFLPDLIKYGNRLVPWSFRKGGILFLFWQKFEKKYNNELVKGAVSKETKFEYAWCLIRSKYSEDIKKGIVLLEGEFIKKKK